MDGLVITRFTEMGHISHPLGVPFVAVARLGIVGRLNTLCRTRQLLLWFQLDGRLSWGTCVGSLWGHAAVMAVPGLTQRLNHG
jgi:hypothetical protein